MKLSTKGRYGLKAMVDLATEYDSDGKLSIAQLSERQGISYSYLEQLISLLKKSHLVSASRGAAGGYKLARPPEDITVGEVLKALEGSTALVECVDTCGAGDAFWGNFLTGLIRGGVRIEKRDLELDKAEALGGASLAGIEFTVTNKSAQRVWVNDESYEPEDEVLTIVTDENGCTATATHHLNINTTPVVGININNTRSLRRLSVRALRPR